MEFKEDIFYVDPMGKPRMTQLDKWEKRAVVEQGAEEGAGVG